MQPSTWATLSHCMGGDKIHYALKSLFWFSIQSDDLNELKIGGPQESKQNPTKHVFLKSAVCEEWKWRVIGEESWRLHERVYGQCGLTKQLAPRQLHEVSQPNISRIITSRWAAPASLWHRTGFYTLLNLWHWLTSKDRTGFLLLSSMEEGRIFYLSKSKAGTSMR